MKPILLILTCAFILFMLSGCVVAPYEPVAYVAPPPPRTAVIVRPAYGHHSHRWQGRGGWR